MGTKLGAGLTAFNEVVVAPYEGSTIGGIFWAHPGAFRMPRVGDIGACKIARHLEAMNGTSLPVFELAGVNLERPFLGCNRYSPDDPFTPIPSLDCLNRGLGEWQQNVTAGKRDSASVFRSLRSTV